jgi:hypothetical protein
MPDWFRQLTRGITNRDQKGAGCTGLGKLVNVP